MCAQAQPLREITVQPGKQGELVLMGLRPRRADTIDILASNVEGVLSIILPDGRELTGNDTRPDGATQGQTKVFRSFSSAGLVRILSPLSGTRLNPAITGSAWMHERRKLLFISQ